MAGALDSAHRKMSRATSTDPVNELHPEIISRVRAETARMRGRKEARKGGREGGREGGRMSRLLYHTRKYLHTLGVGGGGHEEAVAAVAAAVSSGGEGEAGESEGGFGDGADRTRGVQGHAGL